MACISSTCMLHHQLQAQLYWQIIYFIFNIFISEYIINYILNYNFKNCFNGSTGVDKNIVYASVVNKVAFPDLAAGQTLPALSIYDGERRMNVMAASLAQLRLKIPQWGG